MHYVYILESADEKHWYVGVTNNIMRRLEQHNDGDSLHTSKFRPWNVKNIIGFRARERAEKFERYLKTKSGRAFTNKHF